MMGRLRTLSALAGFLILVSAEANAQDTKKDFVPEAVEAPKGAERKTGGVGPDAPTLGGEQFVRRAATEAMAEEKWQEAFKLLEKLIKATPDSDPAKPDLYYRLSEMYWERASSMDIRAFDNEEICLKGVKAKSEEARCVADRERLQQASQKYRDDAIKVYEHIVRNFPRYPRLDSVLFALAFNFQRKQQPESAKKIYIELIKRYPRSEHVPDTLLNVGEIFFENGQVDQAQKAYEKVVTNYKDSPVYGYALYKLAWCYFNLNDHKSALVQFVKVIEHARQNQQGGKNRLTLANEAKKDLVRTYVHIEGANPIKAIAFFQKVAPEDYLDLAEKLAILYGDTGQFDASNKLLRELIKLQPNTYRVVGLQTQIAQNSRNIGNQIDGVKELKRLVSLWRKAKDAKDAEPARVENDRKNLEELLRSAAVTYHRQAIKTKAEEDYAIAFDLYTDYVETFPSGENAYSMTFYYAELLYKLKRWKEAAVHYERTLQIQADGEFTKDAAYGAVLAYKKLLNVRQESVSTDVGSSGDMQSKGEEKKVPEEKPISEDHLRFIAACDLYKKYVTASEELVDIQYDAARIYYDFNHFSEAIPRFKDIAENHSSHRLAIFSANLLLDTYNLMGDYDTLQLQVDKFLTLYTRDRDAEFYDLLSKLKQQATFLKCSGIEAKKLYLEAGRCFQAYAKTYPQSEYMDEALYNAAINYEREKRVDLAVQVRLEMVNSSSESELAPKALYQIAGNLNAMAIYSEASKAYEFFAAQYPEREEAKDALQNAAVFRQGLGELDKALENYRAFLKLIGNDKEKASQVYYSMGLLLQKQEKWREAARHFEDFLQKYGRVAKPDMVFGAYTQLGNSYLKMGGKSNEKSALQAYTTCYETFMKLPDDKKQAITVGLASVAEARFNMGEAVFREFKATSLDIQPLKNVKNHIDKMKERIIAKTGLVNEARKIYLEVIQFRSPNWAIAALCRIGQMFQQLSDDIYNVPAPKSFDAEQEEVFKGAMAEQAQIPEGKAIEAYVLCLKKAQELRWVNEWVGLAEKELAKLRPQEYRSNTEVRSRPIHFGEDFVTQGFITKLPEEQ